LVGTPQNDGLLLSFSTRKRMTRQLSPQFRTSAVSVVPRLPHDAPHPSSHKTPPVDFGSHRAEARQIVPDRSLTIEAGKSSSRAFLVPSSGTELQSSAGVPTGSVYDVVSRSGGRSK